LQQVITTNPSPPQAPQFRGDSYTNLVESVKSLFRWAAKLNNFLNLLLTQLAQNANTGQATFGKNIASASSILVTDSLHHITGTAAIRTINSPPSFAGGPIWLVADGAWSLVTGGNIAAPATPAVGDTVEVIFDPVLKLWYPEASTGGGSGGETIVQISHSGSPYNVPNTGNFFIIANASAGTVVVDLPIATGSGHTVGVTVVNLTNPVTMHPNGSDVINGANASPNISFNLQYDTVYVKDILAGTWAIL